MALFDIDQSSHPILKTPILKTQIIKTHIIKTHISVVGVALDQRPGLVFDWLDQQNVSGRLVAIGHRVVHGGPKYAEPQLITEELLDELQTLSLFDPVHMPMNLLLIQVMRAAFESILQVACFDTAFFHDLPRVAQLLPLPRRYLGQYIRRYGFHGLSYSYLLETLNQLAGESVAQGRVILAHLGGGASLTGVYEGKPVDTSMGFTPTSGLPMGTRSGDLDPGLLCHLMRSEHLDVEGLSDMVNSASGLLGVSETTSDMRELIQAELSDVRAAEAIALFCYQVKQWIGAFAAVLGGLETFVFSGGIGEHSPLIRARICHGLEWLGIRIDPALNEANRSMISLNNAQVGVYVIPTDEEVMIARSVCALLEMV